MLEEDRVELLEALPCVDRVVVFDGDSIEVPFVLPRFRRSVAASFTPPRDT